RDASTPDRLILMGENHPPLDSPSPTSPRRRVLVNSTTTMVGSVRHGRLRSSGVGEASSTTTGMGGSTSCWLAAGDSESGPTAGCRVSGFFAIKEIGR